MPKDNDTPENLRYDLDKLREDVERMAKDVQEATELRLALKDASLALSAMYDLLVQRQSGGILMGAYAHPDSEEGQVLKLARHAIGGVNKFSEYRKHAP